MHAMQAITEQAIQTAVIETDWSDDEDPDHYTFKHFPNAANNNEHDLLQAEIDFSGNCDTETPQIASIEDITGVTRHAFLDNADFQKALEDCEFHADLKWACKWTFHRFSQSTHATWEDLQQEVFIRLGHWLPGYRNEAQRRTVFVKIAMNLLIDARRKEEASRRQHEQVNYEDLASEPTRGEPRTEMENRIFFQECRQSLSQHELAVFDEHFVHGKSLRQLAKNHGVTPAAMSKRRARIIKKLHQR